jgi:hypothetical protein
MNISTYLCAKDSSEGYHSYKQKSLEHDDNGRYLKNLTNLINHRLQKVTAGDGDGMLLRHTKKRRSLLQ